MPRRRDVHVDVAELTLAAADGNMTSLGSLRGVYLAVLWRHRH